MEEIFYAETLGPVVHNVVDCLVVFVLGFKMSDGRDTLLIPVENGRNLLIHTIDFGLRIDFQVRQKTDSFGQGDVSKFKFFVADF